jgi:[ribosomal protein S5]-alanine N-acetyltransferase
MKKQIRVYLRALEIEDHLKIHQWRQDDDIKMNFSGLPLFTSTLNEKVWVENRIFDKNNVSCAICLKDTHEFIGCIFLNEIDHHNRTGHVPVFMGEKKHAGQGLATDARVLMLKYAFIDRGLNRIWAIVIEGNTGALKMLEKTGYQKEGLLRNSRYRQGEFVNEVYMGVLKEDFLKVLEQYEL